MFPLAGFCLIVLALPPVSMDWAAYVFFIPLLFGLDRFRSRPLLAVLEASLFGAALGAYAYLGAYAEGWRLYALAIVLCLLLFAVCGYFTMRLLCLLCGRLRGRGWVLLCPMLWAAGEQVINRIGLPFELALTLDDSLVPLQLASLGGPWLVTVYLLFFQTAVFLCIRSALVFQWRSMFACATVGALSVLLVYSFGTTRMHQLENNDSEQTTVFITQTSLSPTLLRHSADAGVLELVAEQHQTLHQKLTQMPVSDDDIIVWPESANPGLRLAVDNDLLRSKQGAINVVHSYALSHEAELVSETRVLDNLGRAKSTSYKIRPVPFAEIDIAAADVLSLHRLDKQVFGSLICYESSFPGVARKLVKKGAQWLAIQTNDAFEWPSYLYSTNLALARMRAIENGVSVVRSANGGVSAVIDPTGRLQTAVPLFEVDAISGVIYLSNGSTFYTRHGAAIEILFIAVALLIVFCIFLCPAALKSDAPSVSSKSVYGYVFVSCLFMALTVYSVNAWQYETSAQRYKKHFSGQHNLTTHTQYDGENKLNSALGHVLRRYGFAVPRVKFPDSPDGLRDWAHAHGLETARGDLSDTTQVLRFAMTGLIKLAAGSIAVITAREGDIYRLYMPGKNVYRWIPMQRLRRMQIGPVVWLSPRIGESFGNKSAT